MVQDQNDRWQMETDLSTKNTKLNILQQFMRMSVIESQLNRCFRLLEKYLKGVAQEDVSSKIMMNFDLMEEESKDTGKFVGALLEQ